MSAIAKRLSVAALVSVTWFGIARAQDAGGEWQAHLAKGAQLYGINEVLAAGVEIDLALGLAEKNFAPDDPRLVTTWLNMMPLRREQDRLAEAITFGDKVIPALAAQGGEDNPELMAPLVLMAANYRDLQRYAESDRMYARALALYDRYYGDAHPRTVSVMEERAAMLTRAGRSEESLKLWSDLVDLWQYGLGPGHLREAISRRGYADALRKAGKTAEAAEMDRRADEIHAAWERR